MVRAYGRGKGQIMDTRPEGVRTRGISRKTSMDDIQEIARKTSMDDIQEIASKNGRAVTELWKMDRCNPDAKGRRKNRLVDYQL